MSFALLINLFFLHLRNRFLLWRGSPALPYKWLIQLTNDCNSRCVNCEIWKINKEHPSLKLNETSIDHYRDFFQRNGRHLRWLALSGGEITLYRQRDEFLELLKTYCPHLKIITFTTNGLLPQKVLELALKLKTISPQLFIVISLDGEEKHHDEVRGVRGNYQLAEEAYQLLQKHHIPSYFGMTLTEANASWAESAVKKIKSISLIHSEGIYQKEIRIQDEIIQSSLKKILTRYQITRLSELGEYFYLKNALHFLTSKREKLPIPCDVLNSSIHISPHGEILPCMYLGAIGNIKDSLSLEAVLDLDKTKKVREIIRKEQCSKCWMNCYAPHSILEHPIKTIINCLT